MHLHWPASSLRGKLILACVLVQLAAAALLVLGSMRLLQSSMIDQAASETRQVMLLLDQAIAAPLAQRDYATLQQTLDLVRSDAAISYLVLFDHRGKVVVASGWDAARPLPPRDGEVVDLERPDATLHSSVQVAVAGQPLGRVDFGLSTAKLRRVRADFVRRSIAIGALALALSMLVLAAIAFAITRHLTRLANASQRVAQGDFTVHVPVTTNDEIGRLGASFNAMAGALKQRVEALEESEAQQRLHLNVAREEQSRLTTLLGAMQGGIMFVDAHARVIYVNASFLRIWSVPDLAAGWPLSEIVPRLVSQTTPQGAAHLESMLSQNNDVHGGSRELRTLDGRVIVQRMQPVIQGVDGSGCIWFYDDITLERRTEQRAHQALHDPLTGLINRRGLHESLQDTILQATGEQAQFSLMFIDLDDFKHANDVAGHRTGDEILVAVAGALAGQMRKGEFVARLGGDEFAVLCPGVGSSEAGHIAARLVAAVSALHFRACGQALRVGCSIGIANFPGDARTEDDLVGCADAAMYVAKQGGKNGWSAYRDDPLRSPAEY